ncbi:SDR family oxidoreductase [Micromonospora sp. NPDC049679]|uniref:SDR family oxidoreductase n=1 Tax=Micromonospora sp. NPDC049679 TaxID=3155920 RepID=UPI0033FBD56C
MITITGATGQLGRLTVTALLDRGVPAGEIVAAVRNPDKAADLAALGVQVRHADYNQPETLAEAFAGTDRLLLISGSEVGQRVAQHANVVAAAKAAGVRLIAYTSILNADTSGVSLATEHRASEALVRDSGLPFVLLRNGWYLENYTANLAPALQHGAIFGTAGEGRVAAATRADFAAAAAAVLAGEGHENAVYELGADQSFTMAELAAEVTRQSGTEVVYRDLPAEEYTKVLVGVGLPEPVAAMLADSDQGIARGELATDSGDLRTLIGRPTTTLAEGIGAALAA